MDSEQKNEPELFKAFEVLCQSFTFVRQNLSPIAKLAFLPMLFSGMYFLEQYGKSPLDGSYADWILAFVYLVGGTFAYITLQTRMCRFIVHQEFPPSWWFPSWSFRDNSLLFTLMGISILSWGLAGILSLTVAVGGMILAGSPNDSLARQMPAIAICSYVAYLLIFARYSLALPASVLDRDNRPKTAARLFERTKLKLLVVLAPYACLLLASAAAEGFGFRWLEEILEFLASLSLSIVLPFSYKALVDTKETFVQPTVFSTSIRDFAFGTAKAEVGQ